MSDNWGSLVDVFDWDGNGTSESVNLDYRTIQRVRELIISKPPHLVIWETGHGYKTPDPTKETPASYFRHAPKVQKLLQLFYTWCKEEYNEIYCVPEPKDFNLPDLSQSFVKEQMKNHAVVPVIQTLTQGDRILDKCMEDFIIYSEDKGADGKPKRQGINYELVCQKIIELYDIKQDTPSLYYRRLRSNSEFQSYYVKLTTATLRQIIIISFAVKGEIIPLSRVAGIGAQISGLTGIEVRQNWDNMRWGIIFQNGIYDLQNKRMINGGSVLTRNHGIPCDMPEFGVQYDDTLVQVIREICGPELEGFITIMSEALLLKRPDTQTIYFLLGPAGTGKSTLLDIICHMLQYGKNPYVKAPDIVNMTEDRHTKAEIAGSRVICIDEASINLRNKRQRATLMGLASQTGMTVRRNYEDTISVVTQATIICASNNPPQEDEDTDSADLFRRGRYIRIDKKIKNADETLKAKVQDPKYYPAILQELILPRLHELAKNDTWEPREIHPIEVYMEQHEGLVNKIRNFLHVTGITITYDDWNEPDVYNVQPSELYRLFKKYCMAEKMQETPHYLDFTNTLKKKLYWRLEGAQVWDEYTKKKSRQYSIRVKNKNIILAGRNESNIFDTDKIHENILLGGMAPTQQTLPHIKNRNTTATMDQPPPERIQEVGVEWLGLPEIVVQSYINNVDKFWPDLTQITPAPATTLSDMLHIEREEALDMLDELYDRLANY